MSTGARGACFCYLLLLPQSMLMSSLVVVLRWVCSADAFVVQEVCWSWSMDRSMPEPCQVSEIQRFFAFVIVVVVVVILCIRTNDPCKYTFEHQEQFHTNAHIDTQTPYSFLSKLLSIPHKMGCAVFCNFTLEQTPTWRSMQDTHKNKVPLSKNQPNRGIVGK